MTGADYGILLESGSSVLKLAQVPESAGTATALTSLEGNNIASEISLKLASDKYSFSVYDGYNVSGTGVGVAVTNTVKVSANGGTATVEMPETATILFGSSGTYVIGNDTLTMGGTLDNNNAIGTNSSVFALSLTGGAIVSDTFTSSASDLTINGYTYS